MLKEALITSPILKYPDPNKAYTLFTDASKHASNRIQFEYIKGIKNTLADTMSRLIQIDPEGKLQPEQEGYEFGYHAFNDMEPIKCEVNPIDTNTSGDPIPLPGEEIKLPLDDDKLKGFQQKDKFCKDIMEKLEKEQLQNKNPYYQEEGILKRLVADGKQKFEAVVLPQVIKMHYYWKGLKPMVKKHVQTCKLCQEHNKQVGKYSRINFETEQPL